MNEPLRISEMRWVLLALDRGDVLYITNALSRKPRLRFSGGGGWRHVAEPVVNALEDGGWIERQRTGTSWALTAKGKAEVRCAS